MQDITNKQPAQQPPVHDLAPKAKRSKPSAPEVSLPAPKSGPHYTKCELVLIVSEHQNGTAT
eukprot:8753399-Ditylum_brightwellii.AAC.1